MRYGSVKYLNLKNIGSEIIGSVGMRQQVFALPQYTRGMRSRRQLLKHDQPETLGQRLTRLRKAKGITQVELAERLRISQSNYSDYERDNLRLHADIIIELAKILNVSSDEFLGIRPATRQTSVKDKRFLQELAFIDLLPKRDKDALLRTIRLYTARVRTGTTSTRAAAK